MSNLVTFNRQVISRSGNYAGNDTENRAIPHGMSRVPNMILFTSSVTISMIVQSGRVTSLTGGAEYVVTAMDATNFYVGKNTSYNFSCNGTGVTYYWAVV